MTSHGHGVNVLGCAQELILVHVVLDCHEGVLCLTIEVGVLLLLLLSLLFPLLARAGRCAECFRCAVWSVSLSVFLSFLSLLSVSLSLPLLFHAGSLRPTCRRERLPPLLWLVTRLCASPWRCACWIRRRFGSATLIFHNVMCLFDTFTFS